MTLNKDLLQVITNFRPKIVIVGMGVKELDQIERSLTDIHGENSVLVLQGEIVFNSKIDTAAILSDPTSLRSSLFQLNRFCNSAGSRLVIAEGENDAFNRLLMSTGDIYGFGTVCVRSALTFANSEPDFLSSSNFYLNIPSTLQEYEEANSKNWEFLRGIQFLAGLKSSRECIILVGSESATHFREEWNKLIKHLITSFEKSEGNILVIENSSTNTINSSTYDRIMKFDRGALMPGEVVDESLRQELLQCSRVIVFDDWIVPFINQKKASDVRHLMREFQLRLSWLQKNRVCIINSNNRALDISVSSKSKDTSWDIGLHYGHRLVAGKLKSNLALAQTAGSLEVINGVQKYIVEAFDARGRADGANMISSVSKVSSSSAFLQWGAAESTRRKNLRRNAAISGAPLLFIEDGFIRSVSIGLTGSPGLSFLVDDLAPYYDARQWSRIEAMLASDWEMSDIDGKHVDEALSAIRQCRISKYNHAPDFRPEWAQSERPTILLVDQRVGDQSVPSGLGSDQAFRQMVIDAVGDARNPLVVLKRHPDGTLGGKGSYFSRDMLGSLADHPSIVIHDGEINPHALFDVVNDVYCVTSGMGFEALIAGKNVITYGAPFYSGWGLTLDKLQLDWRNRRRSLRDIFYWAYIARSVYYDPSRQHRTDVLGICNAIMAERDVQENNTHA